MDNIREKLLKLVAICPCESSCEGLSGSCPDRKNGCCNNFYKLPYCAFGKLVDHLIANGVTVSEEALPVADEATERSVAVEKTEDQRKHEGFIGHRKLEQEWIPVSEPPKEWRRDNGEMINYLVYVPEFGVDIGNYGEPAKCWLCMGLPCKPTHWAHLPTPPKQEG